MPGTDAQGARWAAAIDAGAFGVWDLDPREDRVHYAPAWKARLGFPRVGASDDTAFWRCRVHPMDLDAMLQALRAHLDGDSPHYDVVLRLRCNGFGYLSMRSRGLVVARDAQGRALRMVGTMVDLSGRTLATPPAGLADDAADPSPPPSRIHLPFHAAIDPVRGADAIETWARGLAGTPAPGPCLAAGRVTETLCELLAHAGREAAAGG